MTSSKRNKTARTLKNSTPVISSRVLHKVNLNKQAIAAAKAKDLADYQQANSAHAQQNQQTTMQGHTQLMGIATDIPSHVQLDMAQPADDDAQTEYEPQSTDQTEPDQVLMIAEPVLPCDTV